MTVDAATRRAVRDRADGRCEYCLLHERHAGRPLHVEHIRAKQHGGSARPENLALARDRCNLYKGPNLSAVDPDTGGVVRLFDPRSDTWSEHFVLAADSTVRGRNPQAGRPFNCCV